MKQYVIDHGKLVPVKRPLHNRPWLIACVLALLAGLSGLGMSLHLNLYVPPQGMMLISQDAHKKLLQPEPLTSSETNGTSPYESIADLYQLSMVFDTVFSDVSLSTEKRQNYLQATSHWATYYAVPPLLILSIIWRESFFDEAMVSKANARGPMQVIYKYHTEKFSRIKKTEKDLHDIDTGIHLGVEILREYFDRHNRDIFKTLFAYVGGEHRAYAQDILTKYFNARIFYEELQK